MTDITTAVPEVCDECLTAIYDEAPGTLRGVEHEEIVQLAIELGGEIGDHRCEKWDDNEVKCACACTRRGRDL